MAIPSSIDLSAIETEELLGGSTNVYYKSCLIGTIEERRNTMWVATTMHPELQSPIGSSMFGALEGAVEWLVLKIAPLVESRLSYPDRAGMSSLGPNSIFS